MIKRRHLVFVGFAILLIFLSGCTSEKNAQNLTNPENIQSASQTGQLVNDTINTPVITILTVKTSETPRTSTVIGLAQNETAYNHLDDNTSYELSLGNISFRKGASSGNLSSYITKINITAKNGGPDPIKLIIGGEVFSDNSGDGCAYDMAKWCGLIYFDKINPGESQTQMANVTFFSKNDFDYLLSKKFEYEVNIKEDNLVTNYGWSNNRNSWIIDMKNST